MKGQPDARGIEYYPEPPINKQNEMLAAHVLHRTVWHEASRGTP